MHTYPGDTAQVVVPTKLRVVILLRKDNSELVKHSKAIERQFVLQQPRQRRQSVVVPKKSMATSIVIWNWRRCENDHFKPDFVREAFDVNQRFEVDIELGSNRVIYTTILNSVSASLKEHYAVPCQV